MQYQYGFVRACWCGQHFQFHSVQRSTLIPKGPDEGYAHGDPDTDPALSIHQSIAITFPVTPRQPPLSYSLCHLPVCSGKLVTVEPPASKQYDTINQKHYLGFTGRKPLVSAQSIDRLAESSVTYSRLSNSFLHTMCHPFSGGSHKFKILGRSNSHSNLSVFHP